VANEFFSMILNSKPGHWSFLPVNCIIKVTDHLLHRCRTFALQLAKIHISLSLISKIFQGVIHRITLNLVGLNYQFLLAVSVYHLRRSQLGRRRWRYAMKTWSLEWETDWFLFNAAFSINLETHWVISFNKIWSLRDTFDRKVLPLTIWETCARFL
jgi:hypothetical protein